MFYVCCAEVTHYQTAVRNLDDGMFGPFWNLEVCEMNERKGEEREQEKR